jgi:hypothetical protein
MGVNARQVRGDQRTEELAAKNDKEIMPEPEENQEFADAHLIHIFNVSPYQHKIEHPSVGVLIVPACKPGHRFSEPAIIKGTMPYGVPTDMTTVEIRRDSGKLFAIDVLGMGPFRDQKNSLMSLGVFIAAGDNLDFTDLVPYQTGKVRGKPQYINVPRWVKKGDSPEKPTEKEIKAAEDQFAKCDFEKIAEADLYHDAGPANKQEGSNNIRAEHRQALRRRGQVRPWDQPLQTMIDCPGCGVKIAPTAVVHSCGAVLNWDKAIELGIKKAEDRPAKKSA